MFAVRRAGGWDCCSGYGDIVRKGGFFKRALWFAPEKACEGEPGTQFQATG